jgi:hypothetical protein
MKSNSANQFINALIFFLILLLSSNLCAQSQFIEVVYLKNGSVIKGIIVETIPNKSIKIQTKDGNTFVFSFNDVEKITKEIEYGISVKGNDESSIRNQTLSETLFIGGEIYYIHISSGSNSINQFIVNPIFGCFVLDNFLLGATIKYENRSISSYTTYQFIIGPIIRYYFGDNSNKIFTYLVLGYLTGKEYSYYNSFSL